MPNFVENQDGGRVFPPKNSHPFLRKTNGPWVNTLISKSETYYDPTGYLGVGICVVVHKELGVRTNFQYFTKQFVSPIVYGITPGMSGAR